MRLDVVSTLALPLLPAAAAWGSLGHITIAYISQNLVKPQTASYLQDLLRNDTPDYLASIATWADSVRYTQFFRFTKNFHFIDAKDAPPHYCDVDLERDCKPEGCVITALQNYTSQLLDTKLEGYRRNQAAKFAIHFVQDLHQPLHVENVALGGNGIHCLWEGRERNLHSIWDSGISEKYLGGIHRAPYDAGAAWATNLTDEIKEGRFAEASKREWASGIDLDDVISTSMIWARESNAYVCSHVLPEGPEAIKGQELSGEYYEKAAPVIELQVAKAGFRLALWLDLIVDRLMEGGAAPSDL